MNSLKFQIKGDESDSKIVPLVCAILSLYPFYVPVVSGLSLSLILLFVGGVFYTLANLGTLCRNRIWSAYAIYLLCLVPAFILTSSGTTLSRMGWVMLTPLFILGLGLTLKFDTKAYLKYLAIAGLPIAAANVFFFFFPDLEWSYLNSPLARVFIEPGSLNQLLIYRSNNIMDPNKSGTLFVNTNNASVYFCCLLFITLYFGVKTKDSRYKIMAIFYFVAQLCTGSRAGLLATAAGCLFLYFKCRPGRSQLKIPMLTFALFPVLIVVGCMLLPYFETMLQRISLNAVASDPRVQLWTYAFSVLSPIGSGFDGWDALSAGIGNSYLASLPLHNHLLMAYSWGGFISLFGYLFFWIIVIGCGISRDSSGQWTTILALVALVVLIHGMFDNYFLGNYNLIAVVFLVIALCSKGDLETRAEVRGETV